MKSAAVIERTGLLIVPLAIFVGVVVPAAPADVVRINVTTVDGRTFSGQFAQFDGRLLQLDSPRATIALDQLLRFERRTAEGLPENSSLIELANGDRLFAEPVLVRDDHLIVQFSFGEKQPVLVPLETVAGFMLFDASRASEAALFQPSLQDSGRADDMVRLDNRDTIFGEFLYMDGREIVMRVADRPLRLPRSGVRSLVFSKQLQSFPENTGTLLLVGLRNGSWITATQFRSTNDGQLYLAAAFGGKLQIPVNELQSLRVLGGRIVLLSELEPLSTHHTPYVTGTCLMQANRSVVGEPLRLRGRLYPHGLGMRSRTIATWALDAGFDSFRSRLGIDDVANGGGSVVFSVLVDGRRVFDSEVLTGHKDAVDTPVIRVAGARELTLQADYAVRGDILDYADWCDPVLIRVQPDEP